MKKILTLLLVVLAGGCTLGRNEAPAVTGPSEFGLAITMAASPDQLPRDGASQSVVTLTARNANGQPQSGQVVTLGVIGNSGARLSQTQVTTGSDGRATFSVIAPPLSSVGNFVEILATPVGGNFDNAQTRSISIAVTGPSNASAPTPSFSLTPATPTLRDTVTFDASATRDEGAVCLDNCTYSWNFGGEATRTGRVVTHAFQSVRAYPVTLTVTDSTGTTTSVTRNVDVTQGTAPTAVISFSPSTPVIFEEITFSAEGSRAQQAGRTITDYRWEFGDGTSASGVRVRKAYNVAATYNVVLTTTDSAGVQATDTAIVTVSAGDATAVFTISPTNPCVGQTVVLDAQASRGSSIGPGGTRSAIVRYIWNFGVDASTTETSSPITTTSFPTANTRTINLTVVDGAGRRAQSSQTVAVSSAVAGTCP